MVHKMNSNRAHIERQLDAVDAQAERDARSPEEQMAELDRRLGVKVGAVKERFRLYKQMQSAAEAAQTEAIDLTRKS